MRACVMLEPQMGMAYERLLEVARHARSLGLEGTFRSDHYSRPGSGEPATDAWATLAGLVRDLDDGVVGTLVSPVTFRHPGNLGKVVATVAHMSRGARVELGLGTGWQEGEHKAFGFPFGTFDDRFRVLAEYLPIVRGILRGEEFSFTGSRYTLEGCASTPPAPDVRVIVGGGGPKRTPRLAARYGDELNVIMLRPADVTERVKTVHAHLEREGRDPAEFRFSWMGQFLIGRSDAELKERAGRLGARFNADADTVLGYLRGRAIVGSVAEAQDHLGELKGAGIDRVMLQHLALDDTDHLAVAAEAALAV